MRQVVPHQLTTKDPRSDSTAIVVLYTSIHRKH